MQLFGVRRLVAAVGLFGRSGVSVLVLALLTTCMASTQSPPTTDLAQLEWMVGAWSEVKPGTETEEHWLPAKGGLMLGLNRTVRAEGRSSFEYLRIARTEKGISYFASPQGRPATEFPLLETADNRVVFENLQHDFPQRIIYWLTPEGHLHARIEGLINKKRRSAEWHWKKQK